ncbi:MAG: hypothetical protein JW971_08670 [Synergistales bacterium]|nr:hypothetical protein [Synergistales bacterium]
MNKRMTVNFGIILFFALLAIFLYNSGKGYDLLLDNQTVNIDGIIFEASGTVRVSVDGGEPIELWIDDRGMTTVRGKKHSIRIEVLDENEEQVISSVEKSFVIDTEKGNLFSIPAILGGSSDWVIPR